MSLFLNEGHELLLLLVNTVLKVSLVLITCNWSCYVKCVSERLMHV